jgi:hypothetical protein
LVSLLRQLVRAAADCIILNAGLAFAFLRLLWAMMYEPDQFEVVSRQNLAEDYLEMY